MSAKSKLNRIEVLISKASIHPVITYDEFVLINTVEKEYDKMKKEFKNLKNEKFMQDFSLFIKPCYHIVWSAENIQKAKTKKMQGQKTED